MQKLNSQNFKSKTKNSTKMRLLNFTTLNIYVDILYLSYVETKTLQVKAFKNIIMKSSYLYTQKIIFLEAKERKLIYSRFTLQYKCVNN